VRRLKKDRERNYAVSPGIEARNQQYTGSFFEPINGSTSLGSKLVASRTVAQQLFRLSARGDNSERPEHHPGRQEENWRRGHKQRSDLR
jgi:hypothetical protein